jgi:hypothetical protein
MLWTHYRRWKSWIAAALVTLAYALIQLAAEGSGRWKAGVIIGLCLGAAYLTEEIVWMAKRQGRPCGLCGQKVQMRPFRVMITCPHCGQALE